MERDLNTKIANLYNKMFFFGINSKLRKIFQKIHFFYFCKNKTQFFENFMPVFNMKILLHQNI